MLKTQLFIKIHLINYVNNVLIIEKKAIKNPEKSGFKVGFLEFSSYQH